MTVLQKVIKYLAIAFAISIIVSIISLGLNIFYSIAGVLNLNKEKKVSNQETSIMNFENNDMTNLDIQVEYANLTIKTGEYLKVETNNKNINYKQENHNLSIIEDKGKWFSNDAKEELIIYIPENLEFQNVHISVGAGKVDIEKLTTKEISFELGAGQTNIQNLNVLEKANIEGGAGKIDILSGTINNLNLEIGVGKAQLTTKLIGNNKIDTGIGNLLINLNGIKEDYKIKASKGLGSIKIDKKEISKKEIYGIGKDYIELDGGIGSITIDFK